MTANNHTPQGLTLVAIDIAKDHHDVLIEPPPPARRRRLRVANQLDVLPPCENSGSAPKVDIGWSEIAETLVVTPSVIEIDELREPRFELSRQIVILQQNAILQRAMVTLDLALRHRMIGLTTRVTHAVLLEPGAELGREIGWSVIAQQPRPLLDGGLIEPGRMERQAQGLGDVRRGHRVAELPGHNVAREIIEYGR
jgi:hypothetical protein